MPSGEISDNDKLMAALAYLIPFIVSAIILVSEDLKARTFQRYHAIQSLAVAAVAVIFSLVVCFVSSFLCCFLMVLIIPLAGEIYCAYLAYQGQYFEIPVLTDFMVNQGWLERYA